MGRICGVADVFDVLTSDRTYKKAYPLDKAWEGCGSQFDPQLLEFFLTYKLAVEPVYKIEDPV